nr:FG-GAP-like repeat-containing protein [Azospirillum lipoferum]
MGIVTGTSGHNTLVGGSGDDVLYGLDGDDRLDGAAGADSLFGGAGDDTLIGSSASAGAIGTIAAPILAHANYSIGDGWGTQDNTPRAVGDINGDGRADLIGFGGGWTFVAYGQADGTFTPSYPSYAYPYFASAAQGFTTQDQSPRFLADVNGDGRDDIIGIASNAVWTGLGQADGTIAYPLYANNGFTRNSGWAPNNQAPRAVGDLNGDGYADLIGFGGGSTVVAFGQANGTFAQASYAYPYFASAAQGFTTQENSPRFVADVNGDGRDDIVAIASNAVWVGLGQANGTIAYPILAHTNFTRDSGWGPQDNTPRAVGDINGDGRADLIGFGSTTVVAFGQADGTFVAGSAGYPYASYNYGYFGLSAGWTSQNQTPRFVADVNGDGRDDIIGIGQNEVYVGLAQAGGDTLVGGSGNDVYEIVNTLDSVIEALSEGIDEVRTTLTVYALPDNVENLTYTGTAAFSGAGNALSNRIQGGNGADTLDGASGIDTLAGSLGNDIYLVDDTADQVVENMGEGVDEVRASCAQYTLSADLETLTFTGTGAFHGTGNASANTVRGSIGNDTLDGGSGADTLIGGLGNDVYVVDDIGDVVTELAGEGTDEVCTSLNAYSLVANVENLTFIGSGAFAGTGNSVANILQGGAGNDTLDGGAGIDTLRGGTGNDTYLVSDAGDVIVEAAGEGTDEVRTTLASYTLAANVENLVYTGTAAFSGNGNTGNNLITGGVGNDSLSGDAGNDTLDGGTGADTLVGGTGNDTYIVDNTGDIVTELAGQGTDTVRTSLASYALGANVENLIYTGSGPVTFTGNALNNSLTGGAGVDLLTGLDGNDTLNGGAGADTLIGGTGNDTYVVDNSGDVLVELPGEGTDTVQSSISHTLLADFENLTLTGSAALTGTGNALNNLLTGNGAANLLTGLEGDDTLNGGGGADTLIGGIGNDLYVVDNAGDVVTELVGEGIDTVNASINWTLGANIENLTLTGSAAITATGNELNNVLTGNSGANVLDGGLGADSMAGGAGNDVYLVDDAGDMVTELAGQGIDEVRTSLSSYLLGANVEALTYTGTGDFTGSGNALDNLLTGGLGNDTLSGGDGVDTLDGGAGSNLLIGGAGNDVYLVGGFGDQVVELAGEGIDEVRTALTGYTLTDGVETLTYTGVAAFAGTGNGLDNLIAGGAGADTLDGGLGADTLIGGLGDDVYVVDSIGDTVIEGADAGIDEVRTTLSAFTLGDNVERLVFQGGGDASGIGNGLDNWLAGNAGNDTLDGAAGNDTLLGGLGDDVLTGGSGADLFAFASGDGQDTITDFDAAQGDRIGLAAGQSYSVDTNANGDAVIVYGTSDILTLVGIQPAAVSSAWFVTI